MYPVGERPALALTGIDGHLSGHIEELGQQDSDQVGCDTGQERNCLSSTSAESAIGSLRGRKVDQAP